MGVNDIGNSYVEIDLGNQHMYLYKEGKMILDSDFVSGNERLNHHTPDGIDAITYKSQNATLRGPGYASFVYYWMPFNGGIGLHDATWRSSFGGDIYKTDGSHGCVNLPKKDVEASVLVFVRLPNDGESNKFNKPTTFILVLLSVSE